MSCQLATAITLPRVSNPAPQGNSRNRCLAPQPYPGAFEVGLHPADSIRDKSLGEKLCVVLDRCADSEQGAAQASGAERVADSSLVREASGSKLRGCEPRQVYRLAIEMRLIEIARLQRSISDRFA